MFITFYLTIFLVMATLISFLAVQAQMQRQRLCLRTVRSKQAVERVRPVRRTPRL